LPEQPVVGARLAGLAFLLRNRSAQAANVAFPWPAFVIGFILSTTALIAGLSPSQFCLMSSAPRGKVHMTTDIAHQQD
jgi:hypothetical protein